MPRFAIKIEYGGAPFAGWQRQRDVPSVQEEIEKALANFTGEAPLIQGAGRTDAGVHALGQVAHFDLSKPWDPFRISEALNHHLKPHPIAITACAEVDEEFHARFSAVERQYLFRLVYRRAPAVVDAGWVWRVNHPLDINAMQAGAAHLIGRHDFTTFRSVMCQAQSPVKTLDELSIETVPSINQVEFRFNIRARSFLHNQVRSFVGTLERVGAGRWSPDDVKTALKTADRSACGPVSPPQGLYLTHVSYENDPF